MRGPSGTSLVLGSRASPGAVIEARRTSKPGGGGWVYADVSDQAGGKPGGGWNTGAVGSCGGHWYALQGGPCIHGDMMEGISGRGTAKQ